MLTERRVAYRAARTVDEAIDLLTADGAHVLAGGTDVVTMRASGRLDASRLVDIKRIAELSTVRSDGGVTTIGATATLDTIVRAIAPSAVHDGAGVVGGWQTRCRATIGGNICRASPAGDTLCGLLVAGALLRLRSPRGDRTVLVQDFFVGPGRTVRASDEVLVGVELASPGGASAYQRFTYRNAMDLAVVGVAMAVSMHAGVCTDARVALGACAPTPVLVPDAARMLVGTAVDADAVRACAAAVAAYARPVDDVRGSAAFRRDVVEPVARRVIRSARDRAMALDGAA